MALLISLGALMESNRTGCNHQEKTSSYRYPLIVFGTNMWNHYQGALGLELARILGPERFSMVLFENVDMERRLLGWRDRNEYEWLIGPAVNGIEQRRMDQRCFDADVMIWGHCPHRILEARTAAGKISLVASERILKKPLHRLRLLNPRYAMGLARFRKLVNHPNVHALAIGYYAPADLKMIGAFGKQVWSWGYFAAVPPIVPESKPKRPLKVLWAGRMLAWKRVDTLVRAIRRVQNSAWVGEATIIGSGPELQRLRLLAKHLGINPERLRFVAPASPEEVRGCMRDADVYVLPSNRMEGWGVVMNEAMSEGCVVIANEEAGAARILIKDGESGLLFRNGDDRQLAALLEMLGRDHALLTRMSRKAWLQIQSLWHPHVAAARLVELCAYLVGRSAAPNYPEGPCASIYDRNTKPEPVAAVV
jgi:glycosyltransferase involved in cell wall biosynthesis